MIDFITNNYQSILGGLIVLAPMLPTLITKVISDRRLNASFQNFKLSSAISVETVERLNQKLEYITQIITLLDSTQARQEWIQEQLSISNAAYEQMQVVIRESLEQIKLANQKLYEKDQTIAWLTEELKKITISLGVRK